VIVAKQATESFATAHVAFGWKHRKLGSNDLVFKPLVISFGVVVEDELRYGSVQGHFSHQLLKAQCAFVRQKDGSTLKIQI
jgi:hypothetical protein